MVKKFKNRFTLKNCLLGSVNLTKTADPDKYKYSGYGIGFDFRSEFSSHSECSSVHIDKKNILINI